MCKLVLTLAFGLVACGGKSGSNDGGGGICTTGATECRRNDVWVCASGGWSFSHTCPSDQTCMDGACARAGSGGSGGHDASGGSGGSGGVGGTGGTGGSGGAGGGTGGGGGGGGGTDSGVSCGDDCGGGSAACDKHACRTGYCYGGSCLTCVSGISNCDQDLVFALPLGQPKCGDTRTAENHFHSGFCQPTPNGPIAVGGNTPDHTWYFQAPTAGFYRITVIPVNDWWAILYAGDGAFCVPPTPSTCRGSSFNGPPGAVESFMVTLDAQGQLIIGVDGRDDVTGNFAVTGPYIIKAERL